MPNTSRHTLVRQPRKKDAGVRGLFHYDLDDPNYKPQYFINKLKEMFGVTTDNALGLELGVSGSMIGHISVRNHHILASLLCRISDLTGMSLNQIREMAGIPVMTREVFVVPTKADIVEDAIAETIEVRDHYFRNNPPDAELENGFESILSTLRGKGSCLIR